MQREGIFKIVMASNGVYSKVRSSGARVEFTDDPLRHLCHISITPPASIGGWQVPHLLYTCNLQVHRTVHCKMYCTSTFLYLDCSISQLMHKGIN